MSRADDLREKMRRGRASILCPAPTPAADHPITVGHDTSVAPDGKIVMNTPAPPPAPKPQKPQKPKGPSHTKPRIDRKFDKFRLPHGTAIEANYDGAAATWTVTMSVPSADAPASVEVMVGASVHGAIMALGRKWYKANVPPVTPVTVEGSAP